KKRLTEEPKMHIVAELSAEGKRDKAEKVMEDILQAHPDVTGVFGINDDTALGALAAVEAAGKGDRIQIVGYDLTPEAKLRINQRRWYGDVAQAPKKIGDLPIAAIDAYFHGKTPPAIVPVPVFSYVRGVEVAPDSSRGAKAATNPTPGK